MKLRNRLLVLQVAIFLVYCALIGAATWALRESAIPLMEQGVKSKASSCIRTLVASLDLALAADDRTLLQHMLTRCHFEGERDPDLQFLAVMDVRNRVRAKLGAVPTGLRAHASFGDTIDVTRSELGFRAHASVRLEGILLGYVWAEYHLQRVERWNRWISVTIVIGLILSLVSFSATLRLIYHLIRPLRDMIAFVHRLALGKLDSYLSVKASDELGQLAADLNVMAGNLRQSSEELAFVSRQAGMADAAAGVLHNVGNVLNSVNTSATLVREGVLALDLERLQRFAVSMKNGQLTLTNDSDKVAHYVASLADHFSVKQDSLIQEVGRLEQHIQHISVVVSSQRALADSGGLVEATVISEVVDMALQLHAASWGRAGVQVIRDYEEVPPLLIDKHKLLQVVINLVSNARDALQDVPEDQRTLALRLSHHQEVVRIEVSDTGRGITAYERHRLFRLGFTTKDAGHGIGLHVSANTVRELGGTLSCRSSGRGRGATFVIRLPLRSAPA